MLEIEYGQYGAGIIAMISGLPRRYYSSRTKPRSLTLEELYSKLQNLYLLFRDRDYFKARSGITQYNLPDAITREAAIALTFQPFPIEGWSREDIAEDKIFDVFEFLYDRISKPEGWAWHTSDSGHNFEDYVGYDDEKGQEEFRKKVNAFLIDYKNGFELTEDGDVLASGEDGLQHILGADIIPYDEANVDSRVRNAIAKWRKRHLLISEKREAIHELADVFEWLKKTKRLGAVLDKKDESAIFDIANNFAIRHHNPRQKTEYDPAIWFSWMFHFYLATYHAVIRLLLREEKKEKSPTSKAQRSR
ncbi:MAG: hypothetical protein MUQ25_00785 [Candidatus Aminicenantes bacterium]|nr:hypothetical protein [Candidatus Aminicenantes bacterium]